MKNAPDFCIEEFVSEDIFRLYGENSVWFVNPIIISLAQFFKDYLTDHFKKIDPEIKTVLVTVNNWKWNGKRNWSGLRTFRYIWGKVRRGQDPAELSQHIGGACNAIDMIFTIVFKDARRKTLTANEVRKIISKDPQPFLDAGLTTLERGSIAPTWVHADCRYTGLKNIMYFGKTKGNN